MHPDWLTAAARLKSARRLTVLTGAGVSAASGVPTFRGPGGLWREYRPEDLATAAAFSRDPRLVWEWYDWRRGIIATCEPNRAHHVLAAWSRRVKAFHLVTQNVDGLHERAKTEHVTRLHGSIWRMRCWRSCGAPEWIDERVPLDPLPPACPRCSGLSRPGVVWFGEALAAGDLAQADAACSCDVFLVAGTSSLVYPAAGLATTARARGAVVIEINPDATPLSPLADVSVRGSAEIVLDALETAVQGGT